MQKEPNNKQKYMLNAKSLCPLRDPKETMHFITVGDAHYFNPTQLNFVLFQSMLAKDRFLDNVPTSDV